MQLTVYSDYSLRVLLYLAVHPAHTATINDIARAYAISRNHLVKVVHNLATQGFLHTTRGRGGGISLADDPANIIVGNVVRKTEGRFDLVECFDNVNNTCPITAACALKSALYEARSAFLDVLDKYTLADVLANDDWLRHKLGLPQE
ncbi:MAG TPA: Rrf2 family transcriptional regulator [Gammaproteobacteria bacterium]|nr:Rrf2 family transcriptional regulator [Gammaproteobacteria bacterium]